MRQLGDNKRSLTSTDNIISGASAAYSPHPIETNFILQNSIYRALRLQPDSILLDSSINAFYQTNLAGSSFETFIKIDSLIGVPDLINAQAMISGFTPTNHVEQNYQNYYNWLLGYLDTTLTSTDTIKLKALASSCPYYDGDVVYLALSLYHLVNRNDIVYETNCDAGMGYGSNAESRSSSERKIKSKTSATNNLADAILIFPNPTQAQVNITVPNSLTNFSVAISDVSGKILQSQCFANNNSIQLNVSNLSGIYLIIIQNNLTNEKTVKKITVQ